MRVKWRQKTNRWKLVSRKVTSNAISSIWCQRPDYFRIKLPRTLFICSLQDSYQRVAAVSRQHNRCHLLRCFIEKVVKTRLPARPNSASVPAMQTQDRIDLDENIGCPLVAWLFAAGRITRIQYCVPIAEVDALVPLSRIRKVYQWPGTLVAIAIIRPRFKGWWKSRIYHRSCADHKHLWYCGGRKTR